MSSVHYRAVIVVGILPPFLMLYRKMYICWLINIATPSNFYHPNALRLWVMLAFLYKSAVTVDWQQLVYMVPNQWLPPKADTCWASLFLNRIFLEQEYLTYHICRSDLSRPVFLSLGKFKICVFQYLKLAEMVKHCSRHILNPLCYIS